jgi:hypothetical protein
MNEPVTMSGLVESWTDSSAASAVKAQNERTYWNIAIVAKYWDDHCATYQPYYQTSQISDIVRRQFSTPTALALFLEMTQIGLKPRQTGSINLAM